MLRIPDYVQIFAACFIGGFAAACIGRWMKK